MKTNLLKIIVISVLMILSLRYTKVIATEPSNWAEWQNENYWEWHVRTTTDDKAFNGKHIEIHDDVIDFYGYGQVSYKDFLYKDYKNTGKKIFKFRIDETKANYHTLDGAGFIFNANKTENNLSGYILLFKQNQVCVYEISNIDISSFETTPSKKIENYGTLISSTSKKNKSIHDLQIEATPTKLVVLESGDEFLSVDLDPSKHVGESFGLISSYVQHDCKILSKIEFSQLQIALEDDKPDPEPNNISSTQTSTDDSKNKQNSNNNENPNTQNDNSKPENSDNKNPNNNQKNESSAKNNNNNNNQNLNNENKNSQVKNDNKNSNSTSQNTKSKTNQNKKDSKTQKAATTQNKSNNEIKPTIKTTNDNKTSSSQDTSNSKSQPQKDSTTSTVSIPHTGLESNTLLKLLIVCLTIFSAYFYKRGF